VEAPDYGEIAARLTRFYPGTTPMSWLIDTPIAMVNACLRMLPRLKAEENLVAVHVGAIGAGTLEKEARSKILRGWESAVHGVTARSKPAPLTPALAAAMGIQVVIEEAKG
jgi:hypothetical protein